MHTPAFSAADYDKKIRQTVPFYDAYFEQAAAAVRERFKRPVRWLDIGCGTGRMAESASSSVPLETFVFLAPSPQMLAIARERFPRPCAQFLPLTAAELPADGQFDALTAMLVLHYFREEERLHILGRCFSALAPGGILLVLNNIAPECEEEQARQEKEWRAFQLGQGKNPEETEAHLARRGREFFPLPPATDLRLFRQSGFRSAEALRASPFQAEYLAIK